MTVGGYDAVITLSPDVDLTWRRANGRGLATAPAAVPRTKIANRCELTELYLVVRGQLSIYKIHLCSANVLMEPGNRYLFILPARRGPHEPVFLPFEDDRITDPSIVAQLRAGR
ncbi:hypothetical protein [Micromonospora chersina]|uniref:DUF7737 domain-containing protein n=1 Tax=Micromonospora chersina TaxID=47854 RepID=UPI003713FD82